MKKVGLFGILAVVVVAVLAIVVAGNMGETSPAFVRGKVILSDDLVEDARGIRTLYISVRDTENPMPPFGAFRKTLTDDPEGEIYEFALTYDNTQRMRPDLSWPETFTLRARLDRDGQGGMDEPGDLVGTVERVARGSRDVIIKIDTKL